MASRTKIQPIYSPEHYRMKILVNGKVFQSELKQLHKAWKSHGIPVPTESFARAKDYYAWVGRLRAACNRAMKSQEVVGVMAKVANDPSLSATKKVWRRLEIQQSCTPPTPDGAVDRLLKACGLDKESKQYRLFFTEYLFFGRKEFSKPFFTVQGKRNSKTDKWEVYLKLEPHTKLEHIEKFWDRVDMQLKLLPDYVGKNKPWETFERDQEIYKAYKKVTKELADKRKQGELEKRCLDELVWLHLKEKNSLRFENMSFEQLRKAKSRVAALDHIVKAKAQV